jgi:hypothetical protein
MHLNNRTQYFDQNTMTYMAIVSKTKKYYEK